MYEDLSLPCNKRTLLNLEGVLATHCNEETAFQNVYTSLLLILSTHPQSTVVVSGSAMPQELTIYKGLKYYAQNEFFKSYLKSAVSHSEMKLIIRIKHLPLITYCSVLQHKTLVV